MKEQSVDAPQRGIPRTLTPVIVFAAVTIGTALVWLAYRLKQRNAFRLAKWVTRRFEPLTRRRRQNNLRLFFQSSGRTEEDLRQTDALHQLYLARMRMEVSHSFKQPPEYLRRDTDLVGEEHLKRVLAKNRGVLLVSGHNATWWFASGALTTRGHPVTVIFTPIAFPRVKRKLLQLTDRYNVKVAFAGREGYRAARQAMERNEILYLSFDVAVTGKRRQCLPFGDAWLEVDTGPAVMAVRSGMPVLQVACLHLDNMRNRFSFYEPDTIELAPDTATVEGLCRLWLRRLENEIRQHPEQWWPWGYVDLLQSPSVPAEPRIPPS